MGGDTTADERSHCGERAGAAPQEELALVIAFCAGEPFRAGQVAFAAAHAPGPRYVLGRGPALASDQHPRLAFGQQRPDGVEAVAALSSPTISRVQMTVCAHPTHLEVENAGRARLLHNGVEAQRASVVSGDSLQLGRTLLLLCVRRPLRLPRPASEYRAHAFGEPDDFGIVGESPVIWKLRQQLAYVAARPGHVLLLGASGSGKELAARAVHGLSKAAGSPLVARNAATIPEGLADAELFGNAKNYPNPGMAPHKGLVGEADGSTLFLDEFAELPNAVQARLLRVLDNGEYHVLGEAHARRAELRLIAATNRSESALKHDLLARFRFKIDLPDLNARREDIPLLARHLLCRAAPHAPADGDAQPRVTCELIAECVAHAYATNVRELESRLLEALSGIAGDGPILSRARPAAAAGPSDAPQRAEPGEIDPTAIQATLDRHNGVIEATWRALGLKNRHALARLITKHGLEIRRRPGTPK